MPTTDYSVTGDGTYSGWDSLSEGTDGYAVVDDSDDTTHDSDSTYLVLPKLVLPSGRVSFTVDWNAQVVGIPDSIAVNVAAKIATNSPKLQIGFCVGTDAEFDASKATLTGDYVVYTRTFSTNPITAASWATNDLPELELCVQMEEFNIATARISLVSAQVTWTRPVSIMHNPDPRCFITS